MLTSAFFRSDARLTVEGREMRVEGRAGEAAAVVKAAAAAAPAKVARKIFETMVRGWRANID